MKSMAGLVYIRSANTHGTSEQDAIASLFSIQAQLKKLGKEVPVFALGYFV